MGFLMLLLLIVLLSLLLLLELLDVTTFAPLQPPWSGVAWVCRQLFNGRLVVLGRIFSKMATEYYLI
jgi:hypothetical protein